MSLTTEYKGHLYQYSLIRILSFNNYLPYQTSIEPKETLLKGILGVMNL